MREAPVVALTAVEEDEGTLAEEPGTPLRIDRALEGAVALCASRSGARDTRHRSPQSSGNRVS